MRRTRLCAVLVLLLLLGAGATATWWYFAALQRPQGLSAEIESALAQQHLGRAERLLRQLAREQPGDFTVRLRWASVLRRLGRTAEGEAALAEAVKGGLPEAKGRREFGLLEAPRDFAIAEQALHRAWRERTDDVEVLQALAEGYAGRRRWREAEEVYDAWLRIDPDRLGSYLGRGEARLERGALPGAMGDLQRVLAQSPCHFRARLLLAHCLLAEARMEDAEAELDTCRRLRPDRAEPLLGLAACTTDRGDLANSNELLRQAALLAPLSTEVLEEQANVFLALGRYDLAQTVLERLVVLAPRNPKGHLKLAQVYSRRDEKERALTHQRQFAELSARIE
jgi:tetratricopeptide (TPR) repeat protein